MGEPMRAGDLKAVLVEGPELRDVRYGGVVILDGIALTVRRPDWSTVAGDQLNRSVAATASGVRASESWRFDLAPGVLICHVDILLEPRALSVTVETEVESPAEVNRAGLVLLHPLELVGRPVTLVGPSGVWQDSFPARVSPHQPFRDFRSMAYAPADGLAIGLDFGDVLYETEDHRNWCDAGWKSYTPPLAHPIPLLLTPGGRRRQRVRLAVSSDRPPAQPRRGASVHVRVRPEVRGVLPALGWGAGPLRRQVLPSLGVAPSFLAVEVLPDAVGRERLHQAAAQARALGLPLRATVAVTEEQASLAVEELARFAPQLSHVCLVDPVTHVSNAALVRNAAAAFDGTSVAVGAGTRGYLAELGGSAQGFGDAQFAQLSISAEVHHSDDERVLDTTRSLPHVVESARAIAGGLPLVVSPLTLAQRLSVHVPADDTYAPWDGAMPPDHRGAEALGRAWCLASVAGLVGAEALAYFSVAPGHGLLDPEGRPTPAATLLNELALRQDHAVLGCDVSDPRSVSALPLGDGAAVTLYLANLTNRRQEVVAEGSGTAAPVLLQPYEVRRLVTTSADVVSTPGRSM